MSMDYRATDKILAQLDRKLRIIFTLQPTNVMTEQRKFLQQPNYNPQFRYPKPKIDFDQIRNRLKQIKTDSSPLGLIFKNKRRELLNAFFLLQSLNQTSSFTKQSIALYGQPSANLILAAQKIIKNTPTHSSQRVKQKPINALKFKQLFDHTLSQLGINWHTQISQKIIARVTTMYYGRKIKIKQSLKTNRDEAECLIRHELIHILRNENGRCQPCKIFVSGMAGYLPTEEGIACYQESKLPYFPQRLWLFSLRALAVAGAIKKSFSQTHESLIEYGATPQLAWRTTLRVKRGLSDTGRAGAFTKDYLYLFGYYFIQDYLKQNGKINELMIGKISPQDLPLIRQLPDIKTAKYLL